MSRFEIADVSRLTKVAPMTLRAWEARHSASRPGRGAEGQRTYSPKEVRRLNLIAEACRTGYRVGDVAGLATAEIAVLMRARRDLWVPDHPEVAELSQAVGAGDAVSISRILESSLAQRALPDFADHVLRPCAAKLGQVACSSESRARERLWVGLLEQSIHGAAIQANRAPSADVHVFSATIGPERHGLGALVAYGIGRLCGAFAVNLGVDLQVSELVDAVRPVPQSILALSFVAEVPVPRLIKMLSTLERELPPSARVVLGGQGLNALGRAPLPSRCLRVKSASEYTETLLLLISESFSSSFHFENQGQAHSSPSGPT